MLERFNGWRGNLFFLYKKQSKLFQPMTTGCYSCALADLWIRYKDFLGFDMKEEAGTGCNAARHSLLGRIGFLPALHYPSIYWWHYVMVSIIQP